MRKPLRLAYGAVERDLVRLTTERVGDAIRSVFQIGVGEDQFICIAIAGLIAALGTAAGTFRELGRIEQGMDEIAAARVILDMMEEARRPASHG